MRFRWHYQVVLWLLLAVMAGGVPQTAYSAGSPVSQKRLKEIAGMSLRSQRASGVQGELQRWFMYKVNEFQHSLDYSFLGRSTVISLGDFNTHYKKILAPPTGTGTVYILWESVSAPSTYEDLSSISFPCDAMGQYTNPVPMDTHWHEFQHAIMMNATLKVDIKDWERYRKPPSDDIPEHVYVESLAEFTMTWLHDLLTVRRFEKRIQEAYETYLDYRSKNIPISYAVEHHIWSKVFEAWKLAWPYTKKIAPMPKSLRDDYRNHTGVVIPFIEDVVKFYMKGGVKYKDGHPIRVPEWTMWPEVMKCPVIMAHGDKKKKIEKDRLTYGFNLKLVERTRPSADRGARMSFINQGNLIVSVDPMDTDTRVDVTYGGGSAAVTARKPSCTIDLSKIDPKKGCRLTFTREKLSSFHGTKTYRIGVHFKNPAKTVNGVRKPSYYFQEKAVYAVQVRGAGQLATYPPSSPQPKATPSGPATTGAAPAAWVLKKEWHEEYLDSMWAGQPHKFTQSVSQTGASMACIYKKEKNKPQKIKKSRHSWNHPGPRLIPGTTLTLNLTTADTGSQNVDTTGPCSSFNTFVKAWRTGAGSKIGYSQKIRCVQPGQRVCAGRAPKKSTDKYEMHIPDGDPGDIIHIQIDADNGPMNPKAFFDYEFQGQPAPPKPATPRPATPKPAPVDPAVEMTAQEPKPKPLDPQLDDEPPEPGELVTVVPELPITPPGPPPRPRRKVTRWYVHPEGDYRIPLLKNWAKDDELQDEESDYLVPSDWSMMIACAKEIDAVDRGREKETLHRFAGSLSPGGDELKKIFLKIGGAETLRVSRYTPEDNQTLWTYYVAHRGRWYYIVASMPPDTGRVACPKAITTMLNGLEFLR